MNSVVCTEELLWPQARTAQRDEEFSTISAELQAVQMAGTKLSVELKASQVAREALGAAQVSVFVLP